MIRILCVLVGVLVMAPWESFAQLSRQSFSSEHVRATLWPVLQDDKPSTQFAVQYGCKLASDLGLSIEVSSIERISTDATWFVSRSNHISSEINLKKQVGKRTTINLNSYTIFDRRGTGAVTKAFTGTGIFNLTKGRSVILELSTRKDDVNTKFSVGEEIHISPNVYSNNSVRLIYKGRPKGNTRMYVEAGVGSFYQKSQVLARVGEEWNPMKQLILRADIELSAVSNDNGAGLMPRFMLDYQISKSLSTKVFALNNSYMKLNGVMASVQYRKNSHRVLVEYRELRENNFQYVLTSNSFFTSRLMLSYTYRING